MANTYKIVRKRTGRGGAYVSASLNVPLVIADSVPENVEFELELREEGILYRPVEVAPEVPPEMPSWAQEDVPLTVSDALAQADRELAVGKGD